MYDWQGFDANTGRIRSICSSTNPGGNNGCDGNLANAPGNIVAKTDINDPSCSSTNPCYTYGTNNTLTHAMQSITPCATCTVDGVLGGHNALFYYDADGNMNCVTTHAQCDAYASRSQTWTSFNLPASVVQGATNIPPRSWRTTQRLPRAMPTRISISW